MEGHRLNSDQGMGAMGCPEGGGDVGGCGESGFVGGDGGEAGLSVGASVRVLFPVGEVGVWLPEKTPANFCSAPLTKPKLTPTNQLARHLLVSRESFVTFDGTLVIPAKSSLIAFRCP